MAVLDDLKPKKVFQYFEKICSYPHGSGDVQALSDYYVEFAKEHGFFVKQDAMGNIIMRKEATPGYENVDPVIIQGHLDMVCEKTRESTIDFAKDGLELCTDGKKVWAKGTTLGGDDGIAGAYALAIFDSDDIPHPMIEMIMTVDEEIGLLGAAEIDLSEIKARKLINLDSEDEGIFLTSCAGGLTLTSEVPMDFVKKIGDVYEIDFSGVKGGHSGTEIIRGRINSNCYMGRVLDEINRKIGCDVVWTAGGTKDNAIPRYTNAKILVTDGEKLAKLLQDIQGKLREEFAGIDDDVTVSAVKISTQEETYCLTKESQGKLSVLLMNMPNGIQAMSQDVEDMVETSLNMGVMELRHEGEGKGKLMMKSSVRSSKESAKAYLTRRCEALVEMAGGTATATGVYPGWAYNRESSLRDTFVDAYTKLYKEPPVCQGIHAGVECGLFAGKLEGLDCISLGPQIDDVHTAEECIYVDSVERTWNLLLEVLSRK